MDIELKEASFSYGEHLVIDQLNFKMKPGKVYALFGPNGRGKTTLLKLINHSLTLDTGSLIGVPDNRMFIWDSTLPFKFLTGNEFISYTMSLKKKTVNSGELLSISTLLGLDPNTQLNQFVGSYSKGMVYKLLLIIVLLSKPELLLLDEPFTELDTRVNRQMSKLLRESSISTVLFSTHTAEIAFRYSEVILYLEANKIISEETSSFKNATELEDYIAGAMGKS